MKKILNTFFCTLFFILLASCGTRQFLGFEEKKVRLEGKRIPILGDVVEKNVISSDTAKIIISKKVENKDWKQSYNSPSHVSINFFSDTTFKKIRRIASGKGEDKHNKIFAQPIVYKNTIFFMDALTNIISYDLIKRKVNWRFSAILQNEDNHNIGGGIALLNNRIIANTPYGEIISLNAKDGSVEWRNNVVSPLRSAPTIYSDKILSLTVDNRLLVLNNDDGKIVWQHEGIFNNTTLIRTPKIAADDNIIIAPYSNGEFYALNYSNGLVLWKDSLVELESNDISNTFTDIDANPVIINNALIVTSAVGKIVALDKRSGRRIWINDITSTQTPLVNGNSIFVINNNKELFNLYLNNGNIRWKTFIEQKSSQNYEYIWYAPILVNDKILLAGGNNKLLIINSISGEIEKELSLPDKPASSPFVADKKLYLMLRNSDILTIE